ncbi:hypothetical protein HRI_000135100 [Hibiscus trionum]|uniref:Uncharacterized protein n=1 Tax=Hibiscus trionum TaxID=183268 RepID=A0A9W7GUI1_HIBTR|nr:hypothetical protein HRI_000135100 [Hibiscus trionum]
MVDSEKHRDFNIKGLSLIDVSSEDDCLINSPLCVPTIPQSTEKGSETKSVRFAMDPETVEISLGSHESHEDGKAKEPLEFSEQKKTSKNGKYNLRKSLAWDSAFFTSEGFLEPEELSSMMGGNDKGHIQTLPGIQEDVNKSYGSLTTLDSETLTLESLEADLFEDVRASIQKSNKVSVTAKSSGKKELKTTDGKTVSSSKKVELTTQDKMKQRGTPKKPNVGVKDSGKTLKPNVLRPQISQTVKSVARSGESTSYLHKPPKVLSRIGPSPKRVSLDSKNVRMEKDTKTVTGRGATVLKTALGSAKNIVPRPKPFSKSSSCSPASTKTELNSSCSSLESCASISSNRTSKSSLNLIKHKNGSRIVPKSKIQVGSLKLPTFFKSSTKISSSISPASSISEWSSESSSSLSAGNQSYNSVRDSLSSGSRKGPAINHDAHQVLDSHNHPTSQCSQGDGTEVTGSLNESKNKVSAGTSKLLHPASMKPSGLRMPSPKLGFFDGVRSSGRTPNRSILSHPGVPSGLPKIGVKNTSPSGSSNKEKIGKLQPVRTHTAIQSPKVAVKQTSSAIKSKSSLSTKKSPIAVTSVPSSSRSLKTCPGISQKLQNKSSPRNGIGSAKKVVGQGSKDGSRTNDMKVVPVDGVLETTANIASKSDVENTIPSKEAAENDAHSYPCVKTNTVFLYDGNKKEEAPAEKQIGTVRKEPIAVFENSLSNPTPTSPSPMTSEVTCSSRTPFSVKDSFYNTDASHDVLSGLAAAEKTTPLPFLESTFPENNI